MGADGFVVGPTYAQLSSLYLLSTLDVINVKFWTRLSPPFLSGGSKVIPRIICAEEEPGNEAIIAHLYTQMACIPGDKNFCAIMHVITMIEYTYIHAPLHVQVFIGIPTSVGVYVHLCMILPSCTCTCTLDPTKCLNVCFLLYRIGKPLLALLVVHMCL